MNLESLANELLLDLFEYISTVHLLRAFYDLNLRFNHLLLDHLQTYSLDFRSVSKTNFDMICQQYLPSLADYIISLHLSVDNETPEQIHLFFSYVPTLNDFTHLQSLSLYNIHSAKTVEKLMIEWHQLQNLTYLYIVDCCLQDHQCNLIKITNNIWSLPKLICCHLDIYREKENIFNAPNIISTSIQYLNIKTLICHFTELLHLFRNTPSLRNLSIGDIQLDANTEQLSLIPSSITKFKLTFSNSINIFRNLLPMIPNLTDLTVETWNVNINGYRWEQIINTYLPKLRIFRFKMAVKIDTNDKTRKHKIDELSDSFRTQFWLVQHQWYVRCDWSRGVEHKYIYLYTLPYSYSYFPSYASSIQSKSTFPYDYNHKIYKHVHLLRYQFGTFKGLASSDIRFSHIQSLSIRLPVTNHFWTVIPTLDKLTSLTVWTDDQYRVQALLDQARNLYSLTFVSWSTPRVPVLDITSKSIRRIDLQSNIRYFDNQQCVDLCHSSLGRQCEVLGIHIAKRENIIYLVNKMINLRTLNMKCLEDKYFRQSGILIRNELIEWLKQHLPSTCVITRREDAVYCIHIWIR
jgi:hypothetical protein